MEMKVCDADEEVYSLFRLAVRRLLKINCLAERTPTF